MEDPYLKGPQFHSAAIPDVALSQHPNLHRIFHELECGIAFPKYGFGLVHYIAWEPSFEVATQRYSRDRSHGED
jgi:hypothetical protein